MTIMEAFVDDEAGRLFSAMRGARPVEQVSLTSSPTIEQAYAVQARAIQLRLEEGETLVGMKMGFTSRAKMEQMGVSEMIFGRLTDAMQVENGGSVPRARFIHPRVEPEIAFHVCQPLSGEISREEAQRAVSGVCAAIELIDSRYRDFRFSLTDVVADNSSSATFVLGASLPASDLAIESLGVAMSIDGQPVQIGSTAAILGDPWLSLIEAARFAGKYGFTLAPGQVVLAGAATEAVPIAQGSTVVAEIDELPPVSLRLA